jgi:hypothetical protein
MIFWLPSRKQAGGRGVLGFRVSVALILFSLTFVPVVATHPERWQKLDARGYINDFADWVGFQRNNDYFAASEAARVAPKADFSPVK